MRISPQQLIRMKTITVMIYISIIGLITLIGCKKNNSDTGNNPDTGPANEGLALGQVLPSFTLPDISGHQTSLSSFRGNYVVLLTCNGPCSICIEHYASNGDDLYKKYNGKHDKSGHGFKLVGLINGYIQPNAYPNDAKGWISEVEDWALHPAGDVAGWPSIDISRWTELFDTNTMLSGSYWDPNNLNHTKSTNSLGITSYYEGAGLQAIVLDPDGRILYGSNYTGTPDGVALCNGIKSDTNGISAILDPILTH